jgi:hypothetical protein
LYKPERVRVVLGQRTRVVFGGRIHYVPIPRGVSEYCVNECRGLVAQAMSSLADRVVYCRVVGDAFEKKCLIQRYFEDVSRLRVDLM